MLVVLSVSELTGHLRDTFEADDLLQDLWVRGEVSNLVTSQAGHAYFTLKDSQSQLRCVMFRGQIASARARLQNGASVVAHGRISIYEASGQVQLYVDLVQAQGLGALFMRFEQLRQQLEAEGLFDPARKRPLPRFPRCIGVVTSPTGAALRDIVKVITRRYPAAELILSPTLVQGDGATAGICQALAALNLFGGIDTIILARGGGSLEDLWPFNEEDVARAIFASRIPLVTGIGHETDVTIADMVADVRAPTPSAAAELAVPDRLEYLTQVEGLMHRALAATAGSIGGLRLRYEARDDALLRLIPPPRIDRQRQAIDDLVARARAVVGHSLALSRERVRGNTLQLAALDPEGVLGRGFSVCWHVASGRPVTSVLQVGTGDDLQIQVADGFFPAAAGDLTLDKRAHFE